MGPRLRRLALTVHVACSVGSLGAVAAFLALALAGRSGATLADAAYPGMDLMARAVIVPLVFAALLTGIVQSLGTRWGLFRHWWVIAKLVLTSAAAVVLVLQLETIAFLAAASSGAALDAGPASMRMSPVLHAAGGLLVLLLPLALSIYKPRGLTRYGWRKEQEERGSDKLPTGSETMAD